MSSEDQREGSRVRPRSLRTSTVHGAVLTVCFFLFLFVCKLYLDQYIQIRRLEERQRQKRSELAEEQKRLEAMKKDVMFLGTLQGIEKVAREKLKYIKKDEVIIVPVDGR